MKFARKLSIASILLVAAAVLSACSGIPRRESDQQLLARYERYAGPRVSDFQTYGRFDSWSVVDDRHVLIQTGPRDAYLVSLVPPCLNLPFATRIGVTSRFPHTVQAGFDSIRVGRESCRIFDIRPVNYRQMRADLKAEQARG